MTQLPPILLAVLALALAQQAAAAGPRATSPQPAPAHAPQAAKIPPAKPKTDPTKQRDCEHAWAAQRIRKGSHHAFIRACVRHG